MGTTRARTRRLLTGLLALVVVVMLLLGAGGWYFAGQIRSDGLAVTHDGDPYDLTVVAVGSGTVRLREAPGRPRQDMLRRRDTSGLAWPGGSGVLGPAGTADGNGAVLRPLRVTTGSSPHVGSRAALHVQVFSDPLSAYGKPFRSVVVPCAGGRCPAWFVPGTSATWALMVHGKGATRTEPLRALGAVLRAGMPALIVTYRNDQGAPADRSHFYRYGETEWRDLAAAVGYALQHGARRVVLFGFSMGGGIVASFLQHSPRAGVAAALVLDAPMLDFRRTVDYAAAQRTLPLVGGPLPRPLTWTAETIAGLRYGINWQHIDYLDHRSWLRAPALVFHGTADDTVPIVTSDSLARSSPQLVQEVRTPGAAHVGSWNVDPARYTEVLAAFLRPLASADS